MATDVFLFPVPSDLDSDDVRLRDLSAVSGDATANGDTIVATASIISGAASGNQLDQPVFAYSRVITPKRVTLDAEAKGRLVTCRASLIAGKAHGQRVTLLAGVATAGANAGGAELGATVSVVAGLASGVRNWSDDELLILLAA